MLGPREGHNAVRLGEAGPSAGSALIIDASSADVYNLSTGKFSATSSPVNGSRGAVWLTGSESVLLTDGANSQFYEIGRGIFRLGGPVVPQFGAFTATRLNTTPDRSEVLFVGNRAGTSTSAAAIFSGMNAGGPCTAAAQCISGSLSLIHI